MKKRSAAARGLSLGMTLVFTYVNVIYGAIEPARSFWQDRKTAAEKMQGSSGPGEPSSGTVDPGTQDTSLLAQLPASLRGLPEYNLPDASSGGNEDAKKLGALIQNCSFRFPVELDRISSQYGEIKKIHLSENPEAPLVILIQDAHEIESAQRNILNLLRHFDSNLIRESGDGRPMPLIVGMEGSVGAFDLARHRSGKDKTALGLAADFMLRKSFLNGAEFYGLTAEREPLLWGLEDAALYLENVEGYQKGVRAFQKHGKELEDLQAAADGLKEKIYSPGLMELEKALDGYGAGKTGLGPLLKLLASRGGAGGKEFPQTQNFLKALAAEESLDQAQVERERTDLLKVLAGNLDKNSLEKLVQASLAYRVGQWDAAAYYGFLQNLLSASGVSLAGYPAFDRYIRYVLLSRSVNAPRLFDEVESLKEKAVARTAATEQERRLWTVGEDLRRVRKLVRFELGPEDWRRYSERRSDLDALSGRIRSLSAEGAPEAAAPSSELRVQATDQRSDNTAAAFGSWLKECEQFYAAAERRNEALVRNLLAKTAATPSASGVAVMITGGYHTPGVQKELEKRGLSYATLAPRIGRVESGTRYLEFFSETRTPLEKMLLGERLFMQKPSGLTEPVAGFEYVGRMVTGLLDSLSVSIAEFLQSDAGSEVFEDDRGRATVITLQAEGEAAHASMEARAKRGKAVAALLTGAAVFGGAALWITVAGFRSETFALLNGFTQTTRALLSNWQFTAIATAGFAFAAIGLRRWISGRFAAGEESGETTLKTFKPATMRGSYGIARAIANSRLFNAGLDEDWWQGIKAAQNGAWMAFAQFFVAPFVNLLEHASILISIFNPQWMGIVHPQYDMAASLKLGRHAQMMGIVSVLITAASALAAAHFFGPFSGWAAFGWSLAGIYLSLSVMHLAYNLNRSARGEPVMTSADEQTASTILSPKDIDECWYLADEALDLLDMIDKVKEAADKAGRPLVILENRSYGEFALAPIKHILEKRGIPVISVRVSSVRTDGDPNYLDPYLFFPQNCVSPIPDPLKYILEKNPAIVVVDGSSPKVDRDPPGTTHFPGSYKGFRNMIAAINDSISGGTDWKADQFHFNKEILETFRNGDPRYQNFRKMIDPMARQTSGREPYRMGYWTPSGRTTVLPESGLELEMEKHRDVVPSLLDPETLDLGAPLLIVTQTCKTHEDVERDAGRGRPSAAAALGNSGTPHEDAYFNDYQQSHSPEQIREVFAQSMQFAKEILKSGKGPGSPPSIKRGSPLIRLIKIAHEESLRRVLPVFGFSLTLGAIALLPPVLNALGLLSVMEPARWMQASLGTAFIFFAVPGAVKITGGLGRRGRETYDNLTQDEHKRGTVYRIINILIDVLNFYVLNDILKHGGAVTDPSLLTLRALQTTMISTILIAITTPFIVPSTLKSLREDLSRHKSLKPVLYTLLLIGFTGIFGGLITNPLSMIGTALTNPVNKTLWGSLRPIFTVFILLLLSVKWPSLRDQVSDFRRNTFYKIGGMTAAIAGMAAFVILKDYAGVVYEQQALYHFSFTLTAGDWMILAEIVAGILIQTVIKLQLTQAPASHKNASTYLRFVFSALFSPIPYLAVWLWMGRPTPFLDPTVLWYSRVFVPEIFISAALYYATAWFFNASLAEKELTQDKHSSFYPVKPILIASVAILLSVLGGDIVNVFSRSDLWAVLTAPIGKGVSSLLGIGALIVTALGVRLYLKESRQAQPPGEDMIQPMPVFAEPEEMAGNNVLRAMQHLAAFGVDGPGVTRETAGGLTIVTVRGIPFVMREGRNDAIEALSNRMERGILPTVTLPPSTDPDHYFELYAERLEDVVTLEEFLNGNPSLGRRVNANHQIVQALNSLYQDGLSHNALTPSAVHVNIKTGEILISDWSRLEFRQAPRQSFYESRDFANLVRKPFLPGGGVLFGLEPVLEKAREYFSGILQTLQATREQEELHRAVDNLLGEIRREMPLKQTPAPSDLTDWLALHAPQAPVARSDRYGTTIVDLWALWADIPDDLKGALNEAVLKLNPDLQDLFDLARLRQEAPDPMARVHHALHVDNLGHVVGFSDYSFQADGECTLWNFESKGQNDGSNAFFMDSVIAQAKAAGARRLQYNASQDKAFFFRNRFLAKHRFEESTNPSGVTRFTVDLESTVPAPFRPYSPLALALGLVEHAAKIVQIDRGSKGREVTAGLVTHRQWSVFQVRMSPSYSHGIFAFMKRETERFASHLEQWKTSAKEERAALIQGWQNLSDNSWAGPPRILLVPADELSGKEPRNHPVGPTGSLSGEDALDGFRLTDHALISLFEGTNLMDQDKIWETLGDTARIRVSGASLARIIVTDANGKEYYLYQLKAKKLKDGLASYVPLGGHAYVSRKFVGQYARSLGIFIAKDDGQSDWVEIDLTLPMTDIDEFERIFNADAGRWQYFMDPRQALRLELMEELGGTDIRGERTDDGIQLLPPDAFDVVPQAATVGYEALWERWMAEGKWHNPLNSAKFFGYVLVGVNWENIGLTLLQPVIKPLLRRLGFTGFAPQIGEARGAKAVWGVGILSLAAAGAASLWGLTGAVVPLAVLFALASGYVFSGSHKGRSAWQYVVLFAVGTLIAGALIAPAVLFALGTPFSVAIPFVGQGINALLDAENLWQAAGKGFLLSTLVHSMWNLLALIFRLPSATVSRPKLDEEEIQDYVQKFFLTNPGRAHEPVTLRFRKAYASDPDLRKFFVDLARKIGNPEAAGLAFINLRKFFVRYDEFADMVLTDDSFRRFLIRVAEPAGETIEDPFPDELCGIILHYQQGDEDFASFLASFAKASKGRWQDASKGLDSLIIRRPKFGDLLSLHPQVRQFILDLVPAAGPRLHNEMRAITHLLHDHPELESLLISSPDFRRFLLDSVKNNVKGASSLEELCQYLKGDLKLKASLISDLEYKNTFMVRLIRHRGAWIIAPVREFFGRHSDWSQKLNSNSKFRAFAEQIILSAGTHVGVALETLNDMLRRSTAILNGAETFADETAAAVKIRLGQLSQTSEVGRYVNALFLLMAIGTRRSEAAAAAHFQEFVNEDRDTYATQTAWFSRILAPLERGRDCFFAYFQYLLESWLSTKIEIADVRSLLPDADDVMKDAPDRAWGEVVRGTGENRSRAFRLDAERRLVVKRIRGREKPEQELIRMALTSLLLAAMGVPKEQLPVPCRIDGEHYGFITKIPDLDLRITDPAEAGAASFRLENAARRLGQLFRTGGWFSLAPASHSARYDDDNVPSDTVLSSNMLITNELIYENEKSVLLLTPEYIDTQQRQDNFKIGNITRPLDLVRYVNLSRGGEIVDWSDVSWGPGPWVPQSVARKAGQFAFEFTWIALRTLSQNDAELKALWQKYETTPARPPLTAREVLDPSLQDPDLKEEALQAYQFALTNKTLESLGHLYSELTESKMNSSVEATIRVQLARLVKDDSFTWIWDTKVAPPGEIFLETYYPVTNIARLFGKTVYDRQEIRVQEKHILNLRSALKVIEALFKANADRPLRLDGESVYESVRQGFLNTQPESQPAVSANTGGISVLAKAPWVALMQWLGVSDKKAEDVYDLGIAFWFENLILSGVSSILVNYFNLDPGYANMLVWAGFVLWHLAEFVILSALHWAGRRWFPNSGFFRRIPRAPPLRNTFASLIIALPGFFSVVSPGSLHLILIHGAVNLRLRASAPKDEAKEFRQFIHLQNGPARATWDKLQNNLDLLSAAALFVDPQKEVTAGEEKVSPEDVRAFFDVACNYSLGRLPGDEQTRLAGKHWQMVYELAQLSVDIERDKNDGQLKENALFMARALQMATVAGRWRKEDAVPGRVMTDLLKKSLETLWSGQKPEGLDLAGALRAFDLWAAEVESAHIRDLTKMKYQILKARGDAIQDQEFLQAVRDWREMNSSRDPETDKEAHPLYVITDEAPEDLMLRIGALQGPLETDGEAIAAFLEELKRHGEWVVASEKLEQAGAVQNGTVSLKPFLTGIAGLAEQELKEASVMISGDPNQFDRTGLENLLIAFRLWMGSVSFVAPLRSVGDVLKEMDLILKQA